MVRPRPVLFSNDWRHDSWDGLRFAYLEFLEADAVTTAVQLAGTELHGRPLKVHLFRRMRVAGQPPLSAQRVCGEPPRFCVASF